MSSIVVNHVGEPQRLPPGPDGHWLFGTTREFNGDPFGTILRFHRQYGDAVRFRFLLHYYGYSFAHPDHVKHVFQDNNKNYTKQPHPTYALFKPLVGNGLLTSDGEFWRRQRRLAQPAFHRRQIGGFATTMSEATLETLERWQQQVNTDRPLDIAEEMSRLTLQIAGKTLFSTDLTGDASLVGDAFTQVNEEFARLNSRPFATLAVKVPFLASTRRMMSGIAVLDEIVDQIIADRRQNGDSSDDLLSMLMSARDEETGESMDDKQLRDEVMTILLAGHETTAVALSWVFYCLDRHPEVWDKLLAEVDEVLGARLATMEDLRDLPYTRSVIEETMRLYPPAYAVGRWANEADEVGGFYVAPNSTLTLITYLVHRHPEFWPDPERFDPERFTPENSAERPRHAYVPFGGGPRQCIGNNFAMTEAMLVLVTIAQRFRLTLSPGYQAELEPLITLRPKGGMPMFVQPREEQVPGHILVP